MENEFEERSSLESVLDYAQTFMALVMAASSGCDRDWSGSLLPYQSAAHVYQASTRAVVNVVTGSDYYDVYSASYGAQRLADIRANDDHAKPWMIFRAAGLYGDRKHHRNTY